MDGFTPELKIAILLFMTFEQFCNSEIKSRLIKFFIYNNAQFYHINDIAKQLGVQARVIKGDLLKLLDAGFVKSRSSHSFAVNYKFPYFNELKSLVLKFPAVSNETIVEEIKKVGPVKFLLIAGVFINSPKSRADMIVVGDKISEKKFANFLRLIESSIGKEIHYVQMSVHEFKYRRDMFDRFILDALEFPHLKLINKLKV